MFDSTHTCAVLREGQRDAHFKATSCVCMLGCTYSSLQHTCAVLREGQRHAYSKLLCVCVCAWMYVSEPTHTCAALREGQQHAYCTIICVSVCLDIRVRVYAYVWRAERGTAPCALQSYFVRMHAWMYVLECTHTCGVLREG